MPTPATDLQSCPECDGAGWHADPRSIGRVCHIDPRDPAYPYEHETCEACDGTGHVNPEVLA